MSEQGLSDENSPADVGPAGTGAAEQATQAEIDWQKRYVDTQEAYTRGQQENAELRRQRELYEALLTADDSDTRRDIAEALGYQLEEEETQEYADPLEHYDERIRRIEDAERAREEEQDTAAYAAEVRAIVDERLDQLDGLDKDDQDWVLAYAVHALPPTEEGLPDIEQAYQTFASRETARQRAWAQTKRAPRISPNGQPGTEVPNLDDRQERQDFMVRRLQDNEAQF